MASEGKISVIVPAYNVEKYIVKCVESLKSQTYSELEIIIVNDGSTDGTAQIAADLAQTDERIRVINQPNGGVAAARNAGLAAATGDYIGWVDSDDYVDDDHFEKMMLVFENNDCDIVTIDGNRSGETVFEQPEIMKQYFFHNISCFLWSSLYKAELFDGQRFGRFNIGEDFLIGIAVMSNCKQLVCFGAESYHYVSHGESLLHSQNWAFRIVNCDATDFGLHYVKRQLPKLEKYYNYHILNDNLWHYRATQNLRITPELKAFHRRLRKQTRSIIFKSPFLGEGGAVMKKWCVGLLFAFHLI